jgi:hypothetical protein
VYVVRCLELGDQIVCGDARERVFVGGLLPRARPEAIDAQTPRELTDPGADGLVVAQIAKPLVDAREDLLEDVLRVVLGKPERLGCDRVDVPREPIDECAPGCLVAAPTAVDELRVGWFCAQFSWAERSRFAIVSSSFQAIEAFPSTSGRNSQDVIP